MSQAGTRHRQENRNVMVREEAHHRQQAEEDLHDSAASPLHLERTRVEIRPMFPLKVRLCVSHILVLISQPHTWLVTLLLLRLLLLCVSCSRWTTYWMHKYWFNNTRFCLALNATHVILCSPWGAHHLLQSLCCIGGRERERNLCCGCRYCICLR